MPHPNLASDPVEPVAYYMARTSHGLVRTPQYPDDTEAFGREVWELRRAIGLTLRPAAAAAGLSARELSDVEAGRARLRSPALAMSFLRLAWGPSIPEAPR